MVFLRKILQHNRYLLLGVSDSSVAYGVYSGFPGVGKEGGGGQRKQIFLFFSYYVNHTMDFILGFIIRTYLLA